MSNAIEWRMLNGILAPFRDGQEVVLAPQPGSQQAFVSSPIYETLYEGNRGGGKTLCLLLDFIQHVGTGLGEDWKGIIFRQTHPQLKDIVDMSKKWFKRIWPSAQFNEAKYQWMFPGGEQLMFRHFDNPSDYDNYHGWNVPWLGFEELTTWKDDKCYKVLMSICRTTNPNCPKKIRATTNPSGIGTNWVKRRWRLPTAPGLIVGPIIREVDSEGRKLPERVAIRSKLVENKILTTADPDYVNAISGSARTETERIAWIDGSWDIVSGGMFDDIWMPQVHVVPTIYANMIPLGWRLDRAYDHGQSRPFSVGWWAESNGEPINIKGRKIGTVPGDLIRMAEWYGCHPNPNAVNEGLRMTARDIARGIIEREKEMRLWGHIKTGVADSAIFDDYEPGHSVAGDMKAIGIHWHPTDKGPGSRSQGWQQMRIYLQGAIPKNGPREYPGLFVCESCTDFIRTIPVLPRDQKKIDDVDTNSEDHIGDETRYKLRMRKMMAKSRSWK